MGEGFNPLLFDFNSVENIQMSGIKNCFSYNNMFNILVYNEFKCFSVLADEIINVSVLEQLTVCVWYLSGTCYNIEINEDVLTFYKISS